MPARGPFGLTRSFITLPAVVATGTSAEEYVTDMVPGFQFELTKAWFVVTVVGTGAGATRLFRVVKTVGTTDYVAASATIALADTATKGVIKTFTLSTTQTDCMFYDADKLTIDVTGAGTQFTALSGHFVLEILTRPQARG